MLSSVKAKSTTNNEFKVNIFVVFFATSWPVYMPIFLYTASQHSQYQWTIVSNLKEADLPYPGLAKNIKVVPSTINQFIDRYLFI